MEPFAISIGPREGSRFWDVSVLTPDLEDEVRADLSDLGVQRHQLKVSVGSAGYNADASTIFAVVIGILLFGREVNETLNAWTDLADKLRKVLRALRGKHGSVSVSESAAVLLTLDVLEECGFPIDDLRLVAHEVMPVENGSLPRDLVADFRHQPDRFYLFTFRSADGDTYVVCLRSSGQTEFVHRLPTGSFVDYYSLLRDKAQSDQSI